jgi:dTDP-4-dehydrorhamnose 3,5-epimerase
VLTFKETELAGVVVLEPEEVLDERGSFARLWCRQELAEYGIDFAPVQISLSSNTRRGTLRGLHFQAEPHPEGKLVSCTRGAAFDVAVDLREGSPTYGKWTAVELDAGSHRTVYIPAGVAHGFQTLEDNTELLYLISEYYEPKLQRGIRWDDPTLAIEWPLEPTAISDRDRSLGCVTR